jgi:PKD repeat protein
VAQFAFEPQSPKEGEATRFDASASRDCGPDQTVDECLAQPGPSASIVKYVWEWGDGRTAEGMIQSKSYRTAGVYVVRLTVTNSRGFSDSETAFITVGAGEATKADFFVSPTDPVPGQEVFFDGRKTTTPTGVTISKYEWNFGDGGKATGAQVSHTYTTEGTYTVTLTVTDSRGQKSTANQSVPVKVPVPPAPPD